MSDDASLTVLAALPQLQLLFGLTRGVTPERLCQSAHVSPLDLADPERAVPYAWYRALWGALREHCGARVGIELGTFVSLDHFGYAGQLLRHSRDGVELLEKFCRYGCLFNGRSARYPPRIERASEEVRLVLPRALVPDVPECLDATTFSVVAQLRALCRAPVTLRAARLHLPRESLRTAYEDFLGCSVSFECEDTELVFGRAELACSIAGTDLAIAERIELYVQEALRDQDQRHSLSAITRVIDQQLRSGQLSRQATALALGSSVRSLQRRLSALGTSYQELADARRRATALRLLRQPSLAVYEVALALGYQDVSSFNRAFKRWTGQAPREHRAYTLTIGL